MLIQPELKEAFARFITNEAHIDVFTNGGETETFDTPAGATVPSLRKFLKDKADEINSALVGSIAVGFRSAVSDDGIKSGGTYTPLPTDSNFRAITNGGAFTLAAESGATDAYRLVLHVTNSASAGVITFSGFNVVDGDPLTIVDGDAFLLTITIFLGAATLSVTALQ